MATRAVHVTGFGAPADVGLVCVAAAPKAAGERQVVVRMRMAPVNPADVFSTMGVYPGFTPKALPAVPGLEGMGVVASLGAGASKLRVGQRVVPFVICGEAMLKGGNGAWQDELVIDEDACFPVPDGVDDAAAAQFVVNPFTAWSMIGDLAVPAGGWLIQSAAGSALGKQVIQMCKHKGVRTINLVRRAEQADELRALGADAVICTATEDVGARVKELTGGAGAYGGIDAVGGDLTATMTGALRPGGRLLIYGAMAGLEFKGSIVDVLFRGVSVSGFWVTAWAETAGLARVHALAAELWPLFTSGVVTPKAGQVFPLEKAKEALIASTAAARGDKVLLSF